MGQIKALSIVEALKDSGQYTWVDVRSESEYKHAHIPNAINLPLLNDQERAAVGTIYKQKGREAAVELGLTLIGPKFSTYCKDLLAAGKTSGKPLLVYCWRGGLRSEIAATLIQWSGHPIMMVQGGYQSFRQWVLTTLEAPRHFLLISGYTGTGKTDVLHLLQEQQEAIIDLEGLANHKGSALGGIGLPKQPQNEHFENLLALKLSTIAAEKTIFIENESRMIGQCAIPNGLWRNMQSANCIELLVEKKVRVQRILNEYTHLPLHELIEQTQKLRKRLGGQHEQAAVEALRQGDFKQWVEILLVYYDKSYNHFLEKHDIQAQQLPWDWNQIEQSLLSLKNISQHGFIK